ncbi:patatin-like phospholipase family protein [Ramlibacter paludis]|uniref:patatin-like phospholipase family protein n=1 Tax=Ramlibacter paludis TaxID=2908000 RepID=UPI003211B643
MLNLALQGGGSHGAFTWGVLDALLADGRIQPEGLSGASAGAVNAVALASGWATAEAAGRDPREGARAALRQVWERVTALGSLGVLQQQLTRMLWGGLEFPAVSPYQSNPLGLNPLRDLLNQEIDFHAIAAHRELKVFVSATHVHTGKAVVFTGRQLDASAVMASACLPMLFQAVEIDGQPYWDGGFSLNPPLSPLISQCRTADLMLVQINPLNRGETPHSSPEIRDRVNELMFNASLLTQMRAIDFINRLIADGAVAHDQCKTVRVHRVDAGQSLDAYPSSSRATADGAMIAKLFQAGSEAGQAWLQRHYAAIGHHATVDIRHDYLDDTRMEVPRSPRSPQGWRFRPWLGRLFRQSRP